jgi:hypothetical protein
MRLGGKKQEGQTSCAGKEAEICLIEKYGCKIKIYCHFYETNKHNRTFS